MPQLWKFLHLEEHLAHAGDVDASENSLRKEKTGLCQDKGSGTHPVPLKHTAIKCPFSFLPWANSRRRARAIAALTEPLCRRRGLTAAGKERYRQERPPPAWELLSLASQPGSSSSKLSLLPRSLPPARVPPTTVRGFLRAEMTQKQVHTDYLTQARMITHERCNHVCCATCKKFHTSMYPLCAAGLSVFYVSLCLCLLAVL